MTKKTTFIALLALSALLGACSSEGGEGFEIEPSEPGSATVRIYKDNDSTATGRFIPPSKVRISHTYDSLSGILSNNENVCPSTGDVNLLVIPVHLPDGDAYKTDRVRTDIERIFFSEDDEGLGFPSVHEFYEESSYGKLKFGGKVTDWFDATALKKIDGTPLLSSSLDVTQGTSGTIVSILEAATDWAFETQDISLSDYDKNGDGSIDGIWLVYDHLDWSSEASIAYSEDPNADLSGLNSAFWNFTGWDTNTLPSLETPTTSAFSWASFDMMYTGYCDYDENEAPLFGDFSKIPLDSHTFIHETGHLLGLNDYYSSSDSSYHPAGQSTMMDENVGDLDTYSKLVLGWVTPYIAYGTSEIVLPTVSSSDHAAIVIPSDYASISQDVEASIKRGDIDSYGYEWNPFSEYLLIDLYAPEGLNGRDAYGDIVHGREGTMTGTGLRIYHIDARIFKCSVVAYDGGTKLNYVDGYVWDGDLANFESDEAILMPISNDFVESSTFGLPSSFDYFDEIRLLEAGKINTFDNGEYASNATLWTTSSDPFDINSFGYQFFDGEYSFDGGEDLPFLIAAKTLKEISL